MPPTFGCRAAISFHQACQSSDLRSDMSNIGTVYYWTVLNLACGDNKFVFPKRNCDSRSELLQISLQIQFLCRETANMKRSSLVCTSISGLVLLAFVITLCPDAEAVPSFTRQTGLACTVCHSTPPELTAFGRKFKLDGYTLTDKSRTRPSVIKTCCLADIFRSGA